MDSSSTTQNLPASLHVFPTATHVLFPGMPLPVRDLGCDIGILGERILADGIVGFVPASSLANTLHGRHISPLEIGCAARLCATPIVDDVVVLEGVREFIFLGSVQGESGLVITPHWMPVRDEPSSELSFRMRRLLRGFNRIPDSVAYLLDNPTVPRWVLLNAACYALPWTHVEKQALLRASSLTQRCTMVCGLLEFARAVARINSVGHA